MRTNILHFALLSTLCCAGLARAADSDSAISADGGDKALSQTWNVAADARVEIDNVRGNVAVTGWDQPQVQLSGTLGSGSRLEIAADAQHLALRVRGNNGRWFHGNGPDTDSTLVLKVPRGAALKLAVVSADASVSGVSGRSLDVNGVSGKLTLNSDAPQVDVNCVSGDVVFDATKPNPSGRAHLQTVSGDIRAHGLGGRIKLETVSGEIVLDGGEVEELETGTVSGDAKIAVAPTAHAHVALESMSGDIRLHVPASVSAHMEAKTFSGDILSDFGKAHGREHGSGSNLDVHVGDADAQIRAESFSGDIELRRQ